MAMKIKAKEQRIKIGKYAETAIRIIGLDRKPDPLCLCENYHLLVKISSSLAFSSSLCRPVAMISPFGDISTISGIALTPYTSAATDFHLLRSDRCIQGRPLRLMALTQLSWLSSREIPIICSPWSEYLS